MNIDHLRRARIMTPPTARVRLLNVVATLMCGGTEGQMMTLCRSLDAKRFDLEYIGADNRAHRPIMIHRALFGSFERFIGILIEETGGELPVWLAPVQAIALPIADRHVDAAQAAADRLAQDGIRVEIDERTESVGRKIRDAELQKIPYMLVLGDREAQDGTVGVRRRHEGDLGSMQIGALAERLRPLSTS